MSVAAPMKIAVSNGVSIQWLRIISPQLLGCLEQAALRGVNKCWNLRSSAGLVLRGAETGDHVPADGDASWTEFF
jgi:hypothetical protein